eukprot:CAMPEP_0117418468 /NCGR_PEP_ID=MMETSP0758-20121206/237_1 /TAXON_ID=63605 /ORGANISM="Percolomonas cosmopolitus, Strain AE-1 (ATCC 50343)" /LENGTH=366 /DNA_ID=CAMNT_0005198977 /DNA_START=593 /DNA_END=1694 /DNA_ORIENTATION=-
MIKDRFIKRVEEVDWNKETNVTNITIDEDLVNTADRIKYDDDEAIVDDFTETKIDLKSEIIEIQQGQKRKRMNDNEGEDDEEEEEVGEYVHKNRKKKFKPSSKYNEMDLYRLNFDQYIRHFRNNEITSFVQSRYNQKYSSIIKAMLALTENSQRTRRDELSAEVEFDALFDQIVKSGEESGSTTHVSDMLLDSILKNMSQPHINLLRQLSSRNNGSYQIQLGHITQRIKERYLLNVVSKKFSDIGARIFRLLQDKQQLDDDLISKYCMVPAHEARARLFQMVRAGYVVQTMIPRTSEFNVTKSYFTYSVNLEKAFDILVSDMYKTIRNLRLQMAHKQQQVLNMIGGIEQLQLTITIQKKNKIFWND